MCYSSAHLSPSPVCRSHPLLRVKGGAKQLQVCNQGFADTCIFHASLSKSLTIPITTIHRHEGALDRLCPPGSVTGICPCRVKECRAWLVTAPRGQNTLQIVLHNFYTKMWLNELCVLRMTRKMKPCSCRVGLCC